MLPIGWLVGAVVLAILLTMWVTFTLTRLDRLHARVNAARAALDAQLVRRAVALQNAAASAGPLLTAAQGETYRTVAQQAIDAPSEGSERPGLENRVGRAAGELLELALPLDLAAVDELREASTRVLIARRFYNDAVRDTRALRAGRMPRLFRLAGHAAMPDFFDIDDTLPQVAAVAPSGARVFTEPTEEDR